MADRVMPWHDAPMCPKCKAPCATPLDRRDAFTSAPPSKAAQHLYCPACGEGWLENDAQRVAQAWWSAGAHEARLLFEAHGSADAAHKAEARR